MGVLTVDEAKRVKKQERLMNLCVEDSKHKE